MPRRNAIGLTIAILEASKTAKVKTRIAQTANINQTRVNEILPTLVENKLIQKVGTQHFRTTRLGMNVILMHDEICKKVTAGGES